MICFQDSFLLEVVLTAWSWEVLSALICYWRQQRLSKWHLIWGPWSSLVTVLAAPMTSGHLQELAWTLYLLLNAGALCLGLQTPLYHNCWVLQILLIYGSSKLYLSVSPIKIRTVYHLWPLNAVTGLAGISHRQAIAVYQCCLSGTARGRNGLFKLPVSIAKATEGQLQGLAACSFFSITMFLASPLSLRTVLRAWSPKLQTPLYHNLKP